MMKYRLTLVYILFCISLTAVSVENTPIVNEALRYNIRLWDIENGLPQNSIFAIETTPDGYMWLGTQSGLVRFNGVEFKVYHSDNTHTITNNDIRILLCDSEGYLWIATVSGELHRYRNNTFENMSDVLNYTFTGISILKEDDTGRIWIGTDNKGLVYIDGMEVIEVLNMSSRITGIELDKDGNIIATDEGHIYRIRENATPTVTTVKQIINCLCRKGDKGYWVGTRDGLIFYDNVNGLINREEQLFPKGNIQTLFCDSEYTLWVGTQYDFSFVRNKNVNAIFKNMSSFHDRNILSIYESQNGNIWFGTSQGLYRLTQDRFTALDKHKGLKDDLATACLEDQEGNIWIGTLKGLNYYSARDKAVKYVKHDILENSQILSLFETEGKVYAGTTKGVFILKNSTVIKHISEKNGFKAIYPRTIIKDNEGAVLVGTELGVYRLLNNHIYHLKDGQKDFSEYVYYMSRSSDGKIWAGFNEQLYIYSEETFVSVDLSPDNSYERVLCSYEDEDGYMWFGTYGLGLFRYKDGESHHISTKHGLISNDVFTLNCDAKGFFWISHNDGISQVSMEDINRLINGDIDSLNVKNFTEDDGMKSRECVGGRTPAAGFTKEGVLMVCTVRGLVFTDPLFNYKKKKIVPKVNFERVIADNIDYSLNETPVFPAGTRMISFEFIGINLMSPGKVNYRYRITGENKQWVDIGKDRSIKISNLSPANIYFSWQHVLEMRNGTVLL